MSPSKTLSEILRTGDYELRPSAMKNLYYALERKAGHVLLRRFPPEISHVRLLNLGCGPRYFEGWVNADQYSVKRTLREAAFRPDWMLDVTRQWKCRSSYWDGIFSEHVLEHLTYSQTLFTLSECFRTLKPGAWLRISVPSIVKYMSPYVGLPVPTEIAKLPHRAVAISFVTQMHEHRSTWDAELMCCVLGEQGFVQVMETAFRKGEDSRLLMDDPRKSHDSLYIEARKPLIQSREEPVGVHSEELRV
jgi:predicted SAM-dependent methyltransferase